MISRKSELHSHFIFGIIFNVVSAALNVLTIAVLTRVLTREDFADYVIFLTTANWVCLIVYPGFVNIINKGAMKDNSVFIKYAISKSLKLSLKIWPLFPIVLGCLYFLFDQRQVFIMVAMASLLMIISSWDRSEAILMGKNRFKKYRYVKLLQGCLNLVLVGVVTYISKNVLYAGVGYILTRGVTSVVGMRLAYAHLSELKSREHVEEAKELFNQSRSYNFLAWFNVVADHIDKYILKSLSDASLSYYSVGGNLPLKIKDYAKQAAVVPLMSWLKKGEDHFKVKMKKFGPILILGLIFACVVLSYSAKWYIPFIFGEKYLEAIPVARIMAFLLFPQVLGNFFSLRLIMHSDSNYYHKVMYFRQFLFLAGLFPVIYYFQEVGVASLFLAVGMIELVLVGYHFFKGLK